MPIWANVGFPALMLSRLPLRNVKVLDLSRVLAGPHSTQVLADMGADVTKIEHPLRGDDTRSWGPPFAENGESAYYLSCNRNKRSIGVDFHTEQGQSIVQKLAQQSDVVVENYLPGKLNRFGLGYRDLSALNPKLVYASITGYGQTGPYSNRPGYDVMVEAEFGLMHITGHPSGPPSKVGVALTDLTAGLYTVISVLGALRHAEQSGEGQHLDVALSDCQLASLANIASGVLVSGNRDSGRQGDAHPSICPYQAFPTSDGLIMIGGGNDKLFRLVADALEHPEWKDDPRFSTNASRVEHREILVPAISEITKTKSTRDWEALWAGRGFPYAPINDVMDSLNHPQSKARNMVASVEHPLSGELKLVDHPVKWSKTQPGVRTPPPTLGQHTLEIMCELGYTQKDVEELRSQKIIS